MSQIRQCWRTGRGSLREDGCNCVAGHYLDHGTSHRPGILSVRYWKEATRRWGTHIIGVILSSIEICEVSDLHCIGRWYFTSFGAMSDFSCKALFSSSTPLYFPSLRTSCRYILTYRWINWPNVANAFRVGCLKAEIFDSWLLPV